MAVGLARCGQLMLLAVATPILACCSAGPAASSITPAAAPIAEETVAFEAAGGLDAWRALFEAYADVEPYRPASVGQCPGAPISP